MLLLPTGSRAVSARLNDRMAFFMSDPLIMPRALSASDLATWLGLTKDVEQAATLQRRRLEDYINARNASRGR